MLSKPCRVLVLVLPGECARICSKVWLCNTVGHVLPAGSRQSRSLISLSLPHQLLRCPLATVPRQYSNTLLVNIRRNFTVVKNFLHFLCDIALLVPCLLLIAELMPYQIRVYGQFDPDVSTHCTSVGRIDYRFAIL